MNSLKDFFAWESASLDTIDFKKTYVDMADDLVAGLALSEIVFWFLPDRRGVTKTRIKHEGYDWVAISREEWWDRARLWLISGDDFTSTR